MRERFCPSQDLRLTFSLSERFRHKARFFYTDRVFFYLGTRLQFFDSYAHALILLIPIAARSTIEVQVRSVIHRNTVNHLICNSFIYLND
jgi:hypothetical protein